MRRAAEVAARRSIATIEMTSAARSFCVSLSQRGKIPSSGPERAAYCHEKVEISSREMEGFEQPDQFGGCINRGRHSGGARKLETRLLIHSSFMTTP